MKKNAIVIASIMFVAGCATNQHYSTAQNTPGVDTSDVALTRSTENVARTPTGEAMAPSDPSLSTQYDPASGDFNTYATGSGSSSDSTHRNYTSVNDYHADSSVQGGSNAARGWDTRRDLPAEGAPHPLNPAVQADSSLRGGSMQARQSDWYSKGPFEPTAPRDSRIKADSSIRGGSNQARYPQYQSSADSDESMDQPDGYVEYLVIVPEEADVSSSEIPGQADSVLGSANWNAGDDLLQQGVLTEPSEVTSPKPNNDASVGGAASSETGSASSSGVRNDIDPSSTSGTDTPASSGSSSLSSPGSQKDLNSSANLEKDISGDYQITRSKQSDNGVSDITSSQSERNVSISPETQSDSSIAGDSGQGSIASGSTDVQNSRTSTAVGGPGSTETGSASSAGTYDSSTPVLPADPSRDSYSLFHNNRAQGVGSAATGEAGIANGGAVEVSDDELARQVKSILVKETTGTGDITQREVARDVQVTSRNGEIVLKGTVPSQKAKDMMEIRAREIAGVHRVDNRLAVSPQTESPVRDVDRGHNLDETTSQLHSLDQLKD